MIKLLKKILLYFLFIFPFFFGCNKKESSTKKSPKINQVNGKIIPEIKLYSEGNVYLAVVDTFLVTARTDQPPFFKIYSTSNHKLLNEFGSQGRGPSEFLSPELLTQIGFDSTNSSPVLYVFDFKRQDISTINVFNAIENGSILQQKAISNDSKFWPYFLFKGTNFDIMATNSDGRFTIKNHSSKEKIKVPYFPVLDVEINKSQLSAIYKSSLVVNKEKKLIASAASLIGQLDYFDFNGRHILSTVFESADSYKHEFIRESKFWNKAKYQIQSLDAKNDYIYALNFNDEVIGFYDPENEYNIKLQVFDWEGNAIKEYRLDNRLITFFTVDEIHNRIYGYSPNELEHNIVYYNMN